jgi:WD40 repeat protein
MADDFDPYYTWLGIPPKDQPPNHYRLLGLELFECNQDVIENAADRQMAHIRSMGGAAHAEIAQQILNEIAAARICLLSADKRAAYDAQLSAASRPQRELRRASPRAVPLPQARPADNALNRPEPIPEFPLVSEPSEELPARVSSAPRSGTRGRQSAVFMSIAGAVLLGGVGLGVWLFTRDPGPSGGPAANLPQKTPHTTGPSEQPPKTKLIEKPKPVTKKQATDEPPPPIKATEPVKPAPPAVGELPRYALRFKGKANVELSNTRALLSADEGFTVETWIRLKRREAPQIVVGNLALGELHPDVPDDAYAGWTLLATPLKENQDRLGIALATRIQRQDMGFGGQFLTFKDDPRWRHLAACYSPDGTVEMFGDGRRVMQTTVPRPLSSPMNVCLGATDFTGTLARLDADVCGLRISKGPRYRENFAPTRTLEKDETTLVLLDFSRNEKGTIQDLSGRNHHGTLRGAEWIDSSSTFSDDVSEDELAGLPPYALSFSDRARVELTETARLIESLKEFTVEVWVRVREERGLQTIAGNLAHGVRDPTTGEVKSQGWQLVVNDPGSGRYAFSILRHDRATGKAPLLPITGRWSHVAVTFSEHRQVVYANGEQLTAASLPLPAAGSSNFFLGVSPLARLAEKRFEGDICGLRISRGVRYTKTFLPLQQFARDADTRVLLDFSRKGDTEIRDVSGNGHHGRITDAQWIATRGTSSLPDSKDSVKPKPSSDSLPIAKTPVPDDATQKNLAAEIRKTFADDFAKAKTDEQFLALAEKLLQQAEQGNSDANTRYMLWEEARQLAADHGGLAQARTAAERLTANFAVPWSLWMETFNRVLKSAKTAEARREIAQACMEQATGAFRAEEYAAAEELLTTASTVALRASDNTLSRRARDRGKELGMIKDRKAQSDAAKNALQANDADEKAHLAVGKYACFVRDDWPAGLTHLAKGGNDPLAKLAVRDKADPAAANEQEALADAWQAWSKTVGPGPDRNAAWRRASTWYFKAMPNLDGLAKTRVAQRVEELADKIATTESVISKQPWLEGPEGVLRQWKAHSRPIVVMSVARDAPLVATMVPNEPLKVWHVASLRLVREIAHPEGYHIALSPDGKFLASGATQRESIKLWEVQTGKLVRQFDYSDGKSIGSLTGLQFSSDGQALFASGHHGNIGFVAAWEVRSARPLRRISESDGLWRCAISPDGRRVVAGVMRRHVVRVYDAASGKSVAEFDGHSYLLDDLRCSPDGRTVISAGNNGAFLWDAANGKLIQQLTPARATGVSYSVDGRRMLMSGSAAGIELRDGQGRMIRRLASATSTDWEYYRSQLLADGRAALITNSQGDVQLWRLPD